MCLRTQAMTHVHKPRATLVISFPKIEFCLLKGYIFHFSTPQVNLITHCFKLALGLRVRASLGNRGPSRKGYKMRCLHIFEAYSLIGHIDGTVP